MKVRAKPYGNWEMRSSAASHCKCTADAAHCAMDAAVSSFFVKRKHDNSRGPESGFKVQTGGCKTPTSLSLRKILHTFNVSPHSPYSIGVTGQL